MSETFYRVHWSGSPEFSATNAWSALWGTTRSADGSQTECPVCDGTGQVAGYECENGCDQGWEDCARGYSACSSAADLLAYMEQRGSDDDEPVVIFAGERVGNGPDGEPLAIPTGNVRWTTLGALRATTAGATSA